MAKHQATAAQLSGATLDLMATLMMSLELFTDKELTALANAAQWCDGIVQEQSFAYAKAKKLKLIDDDGKIRDVEEVQQVIAIIQDQRTSGAKTAPTA